MTVNQYTPDVVKNLKGQALRDAYERVFGRPTQSKDSSALRDAITAELKERGKPAAKDKQASPAARAKDAEERGAWSEAAALWQEAAEVAKGKLKATFAGHAAAALVRAGGTTAATKSTEPPKPATKTKEERRAEKQAAKKGGKAKAPKELPDEVKAARAMARALCDKLDIKVEIDGEGRWTLPTLKTIEDVEVTAEQRPDWIKLQMALQVIETFQSSGKAPKREKPANGEKAPKAEKPGVDALKVRLADTAPLTAEDRATFRHLLPAHLRYGKAKDRQYDPSVNEAGEVEWTLVGGSKRAPAKEKPAKAPREPGALKTSSADEMLAALKDGQVLAHAFKKPLNGKTESRVTVKRAPDGTLTFVDADGKPWDSLYKQANSFGASFKSDPYLFYGLRKWKDSRGSTAPTGKSYSELFATLPESVKVFLGNVDNASELADDFAAAAKVLRAMAKLPATTPQDSASTNQDAPEPPAEDAGTEEQPLGSMVMDEGTDMEMDGE